MSDTTRIVADSASWNVVTSAWLDVMTLNAGPRVLSPVEALSRAGQIRCIAMGSPLDMFAAHRFLLTLLYWKAGLAGGVNELRASLTRGELPKSVLEAVEKEADCFYLFGDEKPFLQDTSLRKAVEKKDERKSVGSLFAEFASGSNVAHFHHGDDEKMRLCLRCATIGLLRVVPWSQAGGSGITPSVHKAPPIVAIPLGANLAITLGLNLVPIAAPAGSVRWTGHFRPTAPTAAIPYLEAFTWNPRRINLGSPLAADVCWGCGRRDLPILGPIVYKKNENTGKPPGGGPFEWKDPAAFYGADKPDTAPTREGRRPRKQRRRATDEPYTTAKSYDEESASDGSDVLAIVNEDVSLRATVGIDNPDHGEWQLVIPCTDPANNKTFAHREIDLSGLSADAVRSTVPAKPPDTPRGHRDGWTEPGPAPRAGRAARFVLAATRLLTEGDWAVLSAAAGREMNYSPAAFDVFSGVYWGLRQKKIALPRSRKALWLVLKLMAGVPARARVVREKAPFSPLSLLPKRQLEQRRREGCIRSPYPVSLPAGHRLEADLRREIHKNLRKPTPDAIDWPGLCHGLDRLLD